MKHVQSLENFLNEGAFHVALHKARNEGAKEFEFKGKMYPVKEKKVDEGYEVHYSDGIRGSQKFTDKDKALFFAKNAIKNNKALKDIAIYNASSGFHSTADDKYLLAWWGDGSYWDNISKNDDRIKAKKIDEGYESEVTSILKDAGIDSWFEKGKLYVDKGHEAKAAEALMAAGSIKKLPEIIGENRGSATNEGALSKSEANHLAHKMLNYAVDNGMIPASKKTKEHVDSMTNSLFNAKLDLKKDPRGAAHKILNGLVDRGLIPASKKTEDHISTLADRLQNVELYEAMVQVAGHNKPSGARVLATVIIDYLEDQNFLKLDNTRLKNQLLMDLTDLIMNSTF